MRNAVIVSLVFTFAFAARAETSAQFKPTSVEVYFSPRGGCTEACVAAIATAKKSIYVQAYSFTSAPIAAALVEAKKRGVKIEAVLDKSQRGEKYTEADFIAHHDIPTFIDAKHAIAHNKVMVIDEAVVITGSFNFTKAAETSNAENMLVIHDAKLAARYLENWQAHKAHSSPYSGR
jgi:phosphatidylserine/phosphatidylglycerophosphate/cardiolipin synthase-like enzyme